ncbi:MAG: Maf family protein [Pseudohongiellaceae bacterium]
MPYPRELLLASTSPRRGQLLDQIGIPYQTAPHGIDEIRLRDESPQNFVIRMSREKARSAIQADGPGRRLVLAADTAVVSGAYLMGKPAGREEALAMLKQLSGSEHQVYSAVAVSDGARMETALSATRVWFRSISEAEMAAYWATGEPEGKAGAYGIQGYGSVFIAKLKGSYSGVMGLPLFETVTLLRDFGLAPAWMRRLST